MNTSDSVIQEINDENTQKLIKAVLALESIDRCKTLEGAKKKAKRVLRKMGYL